MLVVDCIELILFHESKQVGELHRDQPSWFQKHLETFDEIVQIRDMCEHVISDYQISSPSLCAEVNRCLFSKKCHPGVDPLLLRHLSNVGCRLHPEYGYPSCNKVLKKVSIIAGDLNHLGTSTQPEAIGDHIHIGFCMGQPGIRKRGKIGVVGKDIVGA